MAGTWGKNIQLSIFGESHGTAVGITINGIPAGVELDLDFIRDEMHRRKPGKNRLATARSESDEFKIISGYFNGRTTGSPLCCIIDNQDKRSKDYSSIKNLVRPGHADLSAKLKYHNFNDYRGGGHFSGRLTAPLVFAGAIAKQLLLERNITIGAHVYSISDIYDTPFDLNNIDETTLQNLTHRDFPTISADSKVQMEQEIINAREELDSIGGVVEVAAINLPGGIGSPFFDSVESVISHLAFSIPGVKGIEFGLGFDITKINGSEANDEMYIEGDQVKTYTNNNGGITGGITNGMPLVYRVAFKPTPSIGKLQRTVDMETGESTTVKIEGRHDPCIVLRALPVVEAITAIALLDLIYDG